MEDGDDFDSATGNPVSAPDGTLRWPTPDRDSAKLGELTGRFEPEEQLGALLQMDGLQGRSEQAILETTGLELKRPRRWHKIYERMGLFHPGDGNTRLARMGRILRDASEPNGLERLIGREALELLKRYQFNNPVERGLPDGCDVHPYYAVLKAASSLSWKIHWDEVNRELMRVMKDSEIDAAVSRIAEAREKAGYEDFIGKASNAAGLLNSRTHEAEASAPPGKTPDGQLRDQQMTPFLRRAGFGGLFLESPGSSGGGYWSVPDGVRDLVAEALSEPPIPRQFATEQEWVEWFFEGTVTVAPAAPPAKPPRPKIPVASLTLNQVRQALDLYEPELVYSDSLLGSLVAALRAGDGKAFVILKGVSGTGKTRLVSAIARAVYGAPDVDLPYLTLIEVRPDWTDGSFLLGHYDPIAERYIRQRFLDALIEAQRALEANSEDPAPVFVCLDEMNLARVEYYLADCLSAMESGSAVPLDVRSDGNVPSAIQWPRNLYLFGTVNVDETTLQISDKVLDRAQVIDTSDIELVPQLEKWLLETSSLDGAERQRARNVIGGVWSILQPLNAHFGFRTARAVVRFIDEAKASSDGALTVDDAIDIQLVQKILVRLRGEGERWVDPLAKLEELVHLPGSAGRALSIVSRMRSELERLGSFQFWN